LDTRKLALLNVPILTSVSSKLTPVPTWPCAQIHPDNTPAPAMMGSKETVLTAKTLMNARFPDLAQCSRHAIIPMDHTSVSVMMGLAVTPAVAVLTSMNVKVTMNVIRPPNVLTILDHIHVNVAMDSLVMAGTVKILTNVPSSTNVPQMPTVLTDMVTTNVHAKRDSWMFHLVIWSVLIVKTSTNVI
jgi:hypothetical protein